MQDKTLTENVPVENPKVKPVPFFTFLEKKQTTVLYTSYTGEEEDYKKKFKGGEPDGVLKQLQTYMTSSNEDAYNELVKKFPDRIFRRTKGQVYEMFDEKQQLEVQVALQIKGHSLTWYFWAPGKMDQYPQEFRDIFYNSAALAHKEVKNGCDLYYRGSNSVHVKLMHHLESESGHNHNHYRLKNNNPYTPDDVNQHLDGLKKTQAWDQFFNGKEELKKLKDKFKEFYEAWYAKSEGGLSKHEIYMSEPSQRLNSGDVIELMLFGHQQEPCRISIDELKVDYNAARAEIESALSSGGNKEALEKKLEEINKQYESLLKYREKGGSRGLFSEIASTRQTYQSELKPISYVAGQDGSFGAPPEIPEWAKKLSALVEESKKSMIETRAEKGVIEDANKSEAMLAFEKEIPEHVRKANAQKKGVNFFQSEKPPEKASEKTELEQLSTPKGMTKSSDS